MNDRQKVMRIRIRLLRDKKENRMSSYTHYIIGKCLDVIFMIPYYIHDIPIFLMDLKLYFLIALKRGDKLWLFS